MNHNIAIIGGGIGGVASALALHRRGIRATVYERAAAIREVGVGMMVWPNATRVLRNLGVLDDLIPLSARNTNFLVRRQDGRVLMSIPLGAFDVPALCARRCDLLAVLLAKLPSDSIRLGHDCSHLDESGPTVRVHFHREESVEHSAVIGADGIRSRVRFQLFGEIPPIHRGYTLWRGIANHESSAVETGVNSETWGRGHRFGMLNTGHGRTTWYATANREDVDLLSVFDGWHEPVMDLIRDSETILRHGALDLTPLRRWSRGRVTLLGDAAHACTPNLGQGCCLALEDAFVVARSIAEESSLANAFARYETLRRPRTSHLQQRSLLMGRVGQWENKLVVAGRNVVTNLLPAGLFEFNLRRVYSYEA